MKIHSNKKYKTYFCFFSIKRLIYKTRLNDLFVHQTDAVLEFKSLNDPFASVNSSPEGKSRGKNDQIIVIFV